MRETRKEVANVRRIQSTKFVNLITKSVNIFVYIVYAGPLMMNDLEYGLYNLYCPNKGGLSESHTSDKSN